MPIATCVAGTYEAVAPSTSQNRQCVACPFNTYQPAAEADSCISMTLCDSGEWTVLEPTPTSDRQCISVNTCVSGTDEATGDTCTCIQSQCARCSSQDAYEDIVLLKVNERAQATSIPHNGQQCFSTLSKVDATDLEYSYACRDVCQSVDACNAFSVNFGNATADVAGKCCLWSKCVLLVIFMSLIYLTACM